ncbi:MAG: rRNA pseudouridine synthase, partial [Bacteroidetes bacterium]
ERKSYGEKKSFGEKREFKPRTEGGSYGGERKSYGEKREFKPRTEGGSYGGERKSYGEKREFKPRTEGGSYGGEKKSWDKEFKPRTFDKETGGYIDKKQGYKSKSGGSFGEKKSYSSGTGNNFKPKSNRFLKDTQKDNFQQREKRPNYDLSDQKTNFRARKNKSERDNKIGDESDEIRLNRYIAKSGVCSRREADELIINGKIKVNGQTITELGHKINKKDRVEHNGKEISLEKFVYLLMNKPKNFITTTEDPEERKTVMDLVKDACPERIYPIGRLDRDTTGLLLLTNDGDLTQKMSHPSFEIRKNYHVFLDKAISIEDLEKIAAGVELEDGKANIDQVMIVDDLGLEVGLELHIGKNRIVRRIFESLGYQVEKLDRTMYAGLTKKDIPRGHWRFLTQQEVIRLKYLNN